MRVEIQCSLRKVQSSQILEIGGSYCIDRTQAKDNNVAETSWVSGDEMDMGGLRNEVTVSGLVGQAMTA